MKIIPSLGAIAGALCILAGCSKPESGTTASAPENEVNTPTPTSRNNAAAPRDYDTNKAGAYEADNTGKNVRDRADATLTPGDQGGSPADREITRQVRRAITANDQLSTDAKNIKIVTVNGKVTLRGPVKSEQEKQAIDAAAKQAGGTAIDDQLEVKSTNN